MALGLIGDLLVVTARNSATGSPIPLASHLFQEVLWIVPAAQSIHILAIAIAMSALLMIHLRSIGVLAQDQTRIEIADRFLPGAVDCVACAARHRLRSSLSPSRRARCAIPRSIGRWDCCSLGIVITLAYARPLRRNPSWWDDLTGRRQLASGIAVTSLLVWVGIVFCGRWIAYVSPLTAWIRHARRHARHY